MIPKFDLVIAFIGSAACNPVIHQLMVEHWDPRFFFSRWDARLIECLLRQQEEAGPDKRNVLILVDDVILTGPAEDQLGKLPQELALAVAVRQVAPDAPRFLAHDLRRP